uniref:Forkhead box N1 n=1 Tax=Varanus komodoensis TaxID=61221 RepID=A0A8D2IN20_VARKO
MRPGWGGNRAPLPASLPPSGPFGGSAWRNGKARGGCRSQKGWPCSRPPNLTAVGRLQESPSFCCASYDGDGRAARTTSESSQSSSPSSPPLDPSYRRVPAGQALHAEKAAYRGGETFRRLSYEDGRPLRDSLRAPFHPYKRRLAEEAFPEPHLPGEGHPFKVAGAGDFAEMVGPAAPAEVEMYPLHMAAWCTGLPFDGQGPEPPAQVLDAHVKLKTPPLEEPPALYGYRAPVPQVYCPSHPFHQYPMGSGHPFGYISASPFPYQRLGPQSTQEYPQPLFPKPIYSYSILIFMALKNSKTGSLPVSEIYNFMTEHFPYFKTAPDGWKNSVRHNLSLNKCFEKVENKSGSSSRKGCLWALNPAKIDKMQEELQKWKRKDPIAVRKSMAKPEELDTLIGEKTEALRPSMLGVAAPTGPRPGALQHHRLREPPASPGTTPVAPAQGPLPARHSLPGMLGEPRAPGCQAAPPGFPPAPPAFPPQLPGASPGPFPAVEAQSGCPGHDSPLPAQTPPGRGMKRLPAPRAMQEVLLPEGDLSNDIDALNPSLTDFDLQGNLWEELKDDSLAMDPLALMPPAPGPPPCFPSPCRTEEDPDGAPGGSQHPSLPNIHLATLYSAFVELETGSPPYLNNPGSKPIALV